MTTETQSTPGHGQGGGQLPDITDPYETVGGDSLPSIAERAGHSGEWLELAGANIGQVDAPELSDEAKAAVVAEKAQRAGLLLTMPPSWNIGAATKPAPKEAAKDQSEVEEAARTAEDFERRQERRSSRG